MVVGGGMVSLRPRALGLTIGILWGAIMLLGTALSVLTGYGESFFLVWASIYPGYDVTWLGVILGAIYGFIDGFVGGWLVGWLYTKLA